MRSLLNRIGAVWLAAGCVQLAGCSAVNRFTRADQADTRTGNPPVAATSHTLLAGGIDAYNTGDYALAIKRLSTTSDAARNDRPTQLEAIKYLAFSYCVSGQTAQCRLQFERALRIDPSFDLAAGEKGHPLWGPVFDRAKKGK